MVSTLVLSISFVLLAASESGELGVKIERNVPVKMRDGTILRADVHRPDRGGPYPVLVRRTWYGKGGISDRFVKAGYIVVSQDARGRYESEGKCESYWRLETHDAEDGYDTVEWAAKLPGSTGKVGTFGRSYSALVQWRLAALRPPSLVAMSAGSIPAQFIDHRFGTIRPGFELKGFVTGRTPDMRRRANRPGVHTKREGYKWFIRLKRTWEGDLTEYGFLFSVAGRVKLPENAAFLPEPTNREEEPVLPVAETMYASIG